MSPKNTGWNGVTPRPPLGGRYVAMRDDAGYPSVQHTTALSYCSHQTMLTAALCAWWKNRRGGGR